MNVWTKRLPDEYTFQGDNQWSMAVPNTIVSIPAQASPRPVFVQLHASVSINNGDGNRGDPHIAASIRIVEINSGRTIVGQSAGITSSNSNFTLPFSLVGVYVCPPNIPAQFHIQLYTRRGTSLVLRGGESHQSDPAYGPGFLCITQISELSSQ